MLRFILLFVLATTVVVNEKSVPVYKGRTPLAYKEYVPKSVRNQRALDKAGLTLPEPMSQEMEDYIKEKRERENEEEE